jgi:phage baseplate assembly protein W
MTLYSKITLEAKKTLEVSQPRAYKGFSTVNTNTENFALYDYELIKQDILNHFHVRKGERLMQPKYGTVIWDLLFEPLTDQVKNLILQNVNEIVNFDPRVQAYNVVVTSYGTGIQIECTLKYIAYNLSERLTLKFDQENAMVTR